MNNSLLLSIIIPAYNGEPYLENALHSLVNQRILDEKLHNLFEIIIVDDGSKDNTCKLAKKLAMELNRKTYRGFTRVISKENGQYGSVINIGVKGSNGLYLKVLDVDDTFNTSSFINFLYTIKSLTQQVDVIYCDHVFEKVGINTRIVETLQDYITPYKIHKIESIKFPKNLITMHSIFYRTQLLKDINYSQIEKVYYSDSQYSIIPLIYAKTLYYVNVPLYRYYIGRKDQSINLKVMVKNIEHQRKVFFKILEDVNFDYIKSKELERYIVFSIRTMLHWYIMLTAFNKSDKEKVKTIKDIFKVIKILQPKKYKSIINGSILCIIFKILNGKLIVPLIKIGAILYSKFNKNIMAEWN